MAKSMDKPEIETLDYRPNCKACSNTDKSCKTIERKYRSGDYPCDKYKPASASPEVKRTSNTVIRPETRVNKADNASQPTEQPNLCPYCRKQPVMNSNAVSCEECSGKMLVEQPNTNAMLIKTIQGLMTCANNELQKLDINHISTKQMLVDKALEEIDLFEKTTLFELQKACE